MRLFTKQYYEILFILKNVLLQYPSIVLHKLKIYTIIIRIKKAFLKRLILFLVNDHALRASTLAPPTLRATPTPS